MNKRKKQTEPSLREYIFAVAIVLGLIWLNTFIHQNSFEGFWGSYGFLRIGLISAVSTIFYYWLCFCDPILVLSRVSTRMCAVIAAISGIIMLIAMLVELGADGFSLYGQKDIVLWWVVTIPKKYFYDTWAIVWFPINISTFFKALRKEQFRRTSIFFICIAIIELTLEGILIFRPMSNIFQVDLIILNTITLAFAIWIYVFPDSHIRKGNAVASVVLYAIMRFLILPLQCDGWGKKFSTFMCGDFYDNYLLGIRDIIQNASIFGTSGYLLNSEFTLDWLQDRNNPIAQLLYYNGWISVIVFIGLLATLVYLLIRLLGMKNSKVHSNWLMFATAATMLFLRTLFGTLYNFGVPFPVGLPFLGNSGSPMDMMAFTLILIGAFENRKINLHSRLPETFSRAEEILGVSDTYTILDEDGEFYIEETDKDSVNIVTRERNIPCIADWYDFEGRDFCVFTIKNTLAEDKERFILEYASEKWILPIDFNETIRAGIIASFADYNQPDCMEEWPDEE